ncbi:MAG: hypothetical protein OEM52_14175 [bacterium]|nr:hypothetical protein [bacterium]
MPKPIHNEGNLRSIRFLSAIALTLGLVRAGWPALGISELLFQVASIFAVSLTILNNVYGLLGKNRREFIKERKLEIAIVGLILFWALSCLLAAYDGHLDPETSRELLKWSAYLLLGVPIGFALTETRFVTKWLFRLQNRFAATFAIVFFSTVVVGALLLNSPGASASGVSVPLMDCLFTSISACAVTGLTTIDVGTTYSSFGKAILTVLMLLGGWGPVTMAGLMRVLSGERMVFHERNVGMDVMADVQHRVAPLMKTVLGVTVVAIGAGTFMLFNLWPDSSLAPLPRLGYAIFHSVSAYCNAGLGLYSDSLLSISEAAPRVLLIISLLVVVGGLGFPVWLDILSTRGSHERHIHSRVTVITTISLIVVGAVFAFYMLPASMEAGEKLTRAIFRSITPRTAGFSDSMLGSWTWFPLTWTAILMVIGAGASSTAGGMKVTTLAVVTMKIFGSKKVWVGEMLKRAVGMLIAYFTVLTLGVAGVFWFESGMHGKYVFECISALSTVGLSMDLTPSLTHGSQFVLMVLMFLGRIGPLALLDMSRKKVEITEAPPPPLLIA